MRLVFIRAIYTSRLQFEDGCLPLSILFANLLPHSRERSVPRRASDASSFQREICVGSGIATEDLIDLIQGF